MVEKPLSTTVADCKRVIEKAKDRCKIWVGLEYRYIPAIAELIQNVSTGVIGPIRMVAIREHRFPFLEKVGNWNRFNENTGGTLVEKCCHFFDLMRLISGSNPVQVFASGNQDVNHLNEIYDGRVPDILDNAYVIVDFESGARGMLDLCMFAEASHNQEEISVVGPLGKIEALVPESVILMEIKSLQGRCPSHRACFFPRINIFMKKSPCGNVVCHTGYVFFPESIVLTKQKNLRDDDSVTQGMCFFLEFIGFLGFHWNIIYNII